MSDPAERQRVVDHGTVTVYARYVMIVVGILFAVFAFLGFRHAKRAEAERVAAETDAGTNGRVTPSPTPTTTSV